MAKTVKQMRKEVESTIKKRKEGERVKPYIVFHCDNCGLSRVEHGAIVPSAMTCSICGNPCRKTWKRPRNYNPEEWKKA